MGVKVRGNVTLAAAGPGTTFDATRAGGMFSVERGSRLALQDLTLFGGFEIPLQGYGRMAKVPLPKGGVGPKVRVLVDGKVSCPAPRWAQAYGDHS